MSYMVYYYLHFVQKFNLSRFCQEPGKNFLDFDSSY